MTTSRDDEPGVTVKQIGGDPTIAAVFQIDVVGGRATGTSVVVDDTAEVLVGTSPVCALRLEDPKVSRRHIVLDTRGAKLFVKDLGSTNGTSVNQVDVVEALLRGGETVQIGGTTLRVTRVDTPVSSNLPVVSKFGRLLGDSRAMRRLFPILERLARTDVPVLIEGETGTGKEVCARALHEMGPKAKAPFVVFDCTAVATNVIESELFGHERGAFTGAVASRKGVFEQADGGTLFIDEIGDLPLDLQSKLLRAIERSEVRHVGGDRWITVSTRIIAATRRDVDALVQQGKFRDDLFHRLAIGRLELPPLRARPEDIRMLVASFSKEADAEAPPIPERLLSDWLNRPWPGNVRELRNAVFRYIALGDLVPEMNAGDTPSAPIPSLGPGPVAQVTEGGDIDGLVRLRLPFPEARDRIVRLFERRYVEHMMQASGGSVQRAAAASGIALRYFQLLRARSGE